mmetsp:Transcript_76778/g.207011  ORF Transcript_76778/g.207011 Transcript_76778/m.207011 type:complete len:206 (-) Transcript_76778:27-644(-)
MLMTIDDVDSGNKAAAHRRHAQSRCGSIVYIVSDQQKPKNRGLFPVRFCAVVGAQIRGDPGHSHHLSAANNRLRALVEADVDERAQQGQEQGRNEREAGHRSIQAATATRRIVVDGFQKAERKRQLILFLGRWRWLGAEERHPNTRSPCNLLRGCCWTYECRGAEAERQNGEHRESRQARAPDKAGHLARCARGRRLTGSYPVLH